MKNIALILVLGLIITGCVYDQFNLSQIKNNSKSDVKIEILYNKETFENNWDSKPYIPYLRSFGLDSGAALIDLDTINLIGRYNLRRNVVFDLGMSSGKFPNLDKFKKVTIIYPDSSLESIASSEMGEKFKKNDDGEYVWAIQGR